jgi:hypothetical protein
VPEQTPQGEPQKSIYVPADANHGAGEGGTYVFTDLEHLDRIINRWTTLREDMAEDGAAIDEAIRQIVPPADDKPSMTQAKAARASLGRGQEHNWAMIDYMERFISKLQATRTQYATTESNNTDALRNVD